MTMQLNVDYHEDDKTVSVTVLRKRNPVSKTITDKSTGITTIHVYKEDSKKPVETYVFNKIKGY